MTKAIIFTGQGAQRVGMGKELYKHFAVAKAVMDEVEDVVDFPLKRMMFEGPEELLRQTNHAQVALMACGIAAFRVLQEKAKKSLWENVQFFAGHSLGEYTALCAAEALTLPQTAVLLKARGQAFLDCAQHYAGGMVAVIGLEKAAIQRVLAQFSHEAGVCLISNDNADGQVVISGADKALDLAQMMLQTAGAKKTIRLPLSGAFHSPLMQEATQTMIPLLQDIPMQPPKIPVVMNATATPETRPEVIKDLLIRQITAPVLWRDSVLYMAHKGVDSFIECGGHILTNMDKRTLPLCTHNAIETGDEDTIKGLFTN